MAGNRQVNRESAKHDTSIPFRCPLYRPTDNPTHVQTNRLFQNKVAKTSCRIPGKPRQQATRHVPFGRARVVPHLLQFKSLGLTRGLPVLPNRPSEARRQGEHGHARPCQPRDIRTWQQKNKDPGARRKETKKQTPRGSKYLMYLKGQVEVQKPKETEEARGDQRKRDNPMIL